MNLRHADRSFAPDVPIRNGDVLAGKYQVDRVLGSGAMGVVVSATHLELHELVAIKFLLPGLDNADAIARFQREARAAARIKGDNVARVTDLGRLENGSPYMVMEYLEGENLGERLKSRGPLPVVDAVDFVTQACEAIAEAHGLGIVHRDLKPSNLFVAPRPDGSERIKVLDFGIAKVSEPPAPGADMRMTKTLAVMGSPIYMSPEQLKSTRTVDARTDVWALGVILYELLTGTVPFNGEEIPELYAKIATGAPPRLDRPDAPKELEAVILRCLEKAREQRYQNVAELASALAKFGSKRAVDSAERASKINQAARLALMKRTGTTTRRSTLRGKKGTLALTGAVALAAVALFVLLGTPALTSQETPAPLAVRAENPAAAVLGKGAPGPTSSSEPAGWLVAASAAIPSYPPPAGSGPRR